MTLKTPFKCYWAHERKVYNVVEYNHTTYGIKSSKGNLHLYDKDKLHNLIMVGIVVLVGQISEQPMVTISEEEYHSLIEEINMLQELIAELSAPVDTAQEQQAETYRELQKLLRNHPSFQDADGKNTTHAEELISTVKVLQSAYDRLASTPAKQEVITSGFKPISEYTLADWELACEEYWVFECRNGYNIRIMETYTDGAYVVRGDDDLTRTIDGRWMAGDTDGDDIVKRVR